VKERLLQIIWNSHLGILVCDDKKYNINEFKNIKKMRDKTRRKQTNPKYLSYIYIYIYILVGQEEE